MLIGMSRWEPHARERLEQAALELFTEHGFGQTSVPQITTRAGLTTRTFFRHFADKREVLFAHEADFPELVAALMVQAPPLLSPMQLIAYGLHAVAALRFEGQRELLRIRQQVISTDDGLIEREMRKYATLSRAVSDGLRDRGTDELSATLTADVAVAVLRVAVTRWLEHGDERPLTELLTETLHALVSVTCERPDGPTGPARHQRASGIDDHDRDCPAHSDRPSPDPHRRTAA